MIPIFSGPNMHGPNLQRSEFTGTHIALVVFKVTALLAGCNKMCGN